MHRFLTILLIGITTLASTSLPLEALDKDVFRKELSKRLKEGRVVLYYKQARLYLFNNIYAYEKEGSENNFIKDLYCNIEYENNVDVTLDDENLPNGNIINTEHTWPKSRFFDYSEGVNHSEHEYNEMLSDMHHLFPTDSSVNSLRASYHYGDVDDNNLEGCESSKFGKNKLYPNMLLMEPPNDVKGDIARGLFYFSVMYELPLDNREEAFLRKWDKLDPVSEFEKFRNDQVEKYQGNRNPFIDYPELVDLLPDL